MPVGLEQHPVRQTDRVRVRHRRSSSTGVCVGKWLVIASLLWGATYGVQAQVAATGKGWLLDAAGSITSAPAEVIAGLGSIKGESSDASAVTSRRTSAMSAPPSSQKSATSRVSDWIGLTPTLAIFSCVALAIALFVITVGMRLFREVVPHVEEIEPAVAPA